MQQSREVFSFKFKCHINANSTDVQLLISTTLMTCSCVCINDILYICKDIYKPSISDQNLVLSTL